MHNEHRFWGRTDVARSATANFVIDGFSSTFTASERSGNDDECCDVCLDACAILACSPIAKCRPASCAIAVCVVCLVLWALHSSVSQFSVRRRDSAIGYDRRSNSGKPLGPAVRAFNSSPTRVDARVAANAARLVSSVAGIDFVAGLEWRRAAGKGKVVGGDAERVFS